MVVGIYNPYHDTLGGGEQYIFTFASYFLAHNHTVIYFSPDPEELERAEDRFHIDLSSAAVHPSVFETGSLSDKLKVTQSLDVFCFYSDGSIPISFAKRTYLIFQFPVPWVKNSLSNKIKLSRMSEIIVNSRFTKSFIDTTFSKDSKVLYPAIDVSQFQSQEKEKQIISVGRFTAGMNTKKQDILIEAFKKLSPTLPGWRLILAGGVRDADRKMVDQLKQQIGSFPIELRPNIGRKELIDLYATSSLYWHAAGFGADERNHPEQVEHFGISTLEAMASGSVPLVYGAGGQKEIVTHTANGIVWQTIDELVSATQELVTDRKQREYLSKQARTRAEDFRVEAFYNTLGKIIV